MAHDHPDNRLKSSKRYGPFIRREWGDNLVQYIPNHWEWDFDAVTEHWYSLERVKGGRYGGQWYIADRDGDEYEESTYGKFVAGPFKRLADAKDFYITLLALKGISLEGKGEP